jgi:hypothetical protein
MKKLNAVFLLCISLIISLIFSLILFSNEAVAAMKNKNIKNPAIQFTGVWRVEEYDFREFDSAPENLEEQLNAKHEYAGFPIGQIIEFRATGSVVMPGTIDPNTMKSNGPIGEGLTMILHSPFDKKLCARDFWREACAKPNVNFTSELIITEMTNWKKDLPEKYLNLWRDVAPIQYTFVNLGKMYNLDVWTVKNGDMMLNTLVKGRAKGGGDAAVLAIRLKRLSN